MTTPLDHKPDIALAAGQDSNEDTFPVAVDNLGRLISSIIVGDSPAIDSSGRFRVSNPETIFDSKQIFDNQPLFWNESLVSGAGITSSHSVNTASTVITSTLNTAGRFVRQTAMRFNYQTGKGQLLKLTGILSRSGGGIGVKRKIGLFDDNDGFVFEDDAGTIKVIRRTNVTGTPVDNVVSQSNWNIDKMDGTGPSGVIVDFSKVQQFIIDFEWLSTGRIRMCLKTGGLVHCFHEFLIANVLDKVATSTPNLPLRYEMETTSSSPASTMECICSTVINEGGTDETGILRTVLSDGAEVICSVENTTYAILGIRLKSTHLGASIKIQDIGIQIQNFSKIGNWKWILNPTVADTFTYNDVTNSAIQVAKGATANTVTGGTQMRAGFANSATGGGGSGGSAGIISNIRLLGAQPDGTQDTMLLVWTPTGGTSGHEIEGIINYRELS